MPLKSPTGFPFVFKALYDFNHDFAIEVSKKIEVCSFFACIADENAYFSGCRISRR
jgi:hypothetical protein